MTSYAGRGSVFIKNVENDETLEFGLLTNQNLNVHGVNLRVGKPNDKRDVEYVHVLEGLPCTLCRDLIIMWHSAAMTALFVRRILHRLLNAFNIRTAPSGEHIGSQRFVLPFTLR